MNKGEADVQQLVLYYVPDLWSEGLGTSLTWTGALVKMLFTFTTHFLIFGISLKGGVFRGHYGNNIYIGFGMVQGGSKLLLNGFFGHSKT